jgi:uncharacterized coiled-coil protein SlyX
MTESPKPLSPGGQSNQVAQDALAHARKRASTSTSKLGPSSTAASGGIGELIPFLRRFLLILFWLFSYLAAAGLDAPEEGGPEAVNNQFASEGGLWAYAQTLDQKVGQLMDKIKTLEGHIVTLERTKTSQEIQISNLTDQVTKLRQEAPDARATAPGSAQPWATGPSITYMRISSLHLNHHFIN